MSPTASAPPALDKLDFDAADLADVEHGNEQAVYFCMLAEFDIDTGATLAHQYPYPTGTDEHRLAELMLPDGAHLRGEDWTIFYLGQTARMSVALPQQNEPTTGDKPRVTAVAKGNQAVLPADGDAKRGTPGGGLLYVLNCVRMKEDTRVRRGAMVKALAIATPNPYIGIYKPLLLLALEEYFNNPSADILAKLYDSANAISTAGMPKLSREEKVLLRQSDRKDLFESRFGLQEGASAIDDASEAGHSGEGVVQHRPPSIASSSRPATLRKGSTSSTQTYGGYIESPPTRRGVPRDTHFYETEAKFRKITVPIRIPMTVFPEDVGDYSIIELVQTFSQNVQPFPGPYHPYLHTNGPNTHPVFVIFNAILAHKRVMFLGAQLPAAQVARMVLAACAMVSGCGQVLRGMTETAFPYANLASLDILEEFSGYVAGVCNPRFEDLPTTWDVLCNVETGRVIVSKELPLLNVKGDMSSEVSFSTSTKDEEASLASNKINNVAKSDCIDNQFMEEILSASTMLYGEQHVRVRWTDYISRFVRLAAYQEQLHLGSTRLGFPYQTFRDQVLGSGIVFIDDQLRQRELRGNAHRIDAWRKTKSYRLVQKDFAQWHETAAIRGCDALHNVKRLRMTRTMSDKEAELILATLQRGVKTYDQVVELLSYLPLHFGGIIPISNGLFHTLPIVRNSTLDLLCQIQQYDVGRQSLLTLNYFHRKAFIELLDRREASRAAQRVLAQQRVAEAEKSSSPPRADIPLPQQAMKVKAG